MDADTRDYVDSLEGQDERIEDTAAELRAIAEECFLLSLGPAPEDTFAALGERIEAVAARLEGS